MGKKITINKSRKERSDQRVPSLIIYAGDRIDTIALDKKKSYTIGRKSNSDIFLADPCASRMHANLYFSQSENQWIYQDLFSTNGTLVGNSHTILDHNEYCFLEDDLVLEIGKTMLRFKYLHQTPEPDLRKKTANINYGASPIVKLKELPLEDLYNMNNELMRLLTNIQKELSERNLSV